MRCWRLFDIVAISCIIKFQLKQLFSRVPQLTGLDREKTAVVRLSHGGIKARENRCAVMRRIFLGFALTRRKGEE